MRRYNETELLLNCIKENRFVFNFDEENKATILNMLQYTLLSIIPVLIILKVIKYVVPEEDESNKFWQMARLTEYYEDLPIYQFMLDGVEGDDLISYVTQLETFVSYDKCIVSSDKDFIQLLDKTNVKLYSPLLKSFVKHDNPNYFLLEHKE